MANHLERCSTCCVLLDRWSDPSGLIEGLGPVSEPRRPLSPALKRVLSGLKTRSIDPEIGATMESNGCRGSGSGSLETEGVVDDQAEMVPEGLVPSDRPGSLGRLGPYEVIGRVGHGGMGVVFKALDTALNRVVAIKVLSLAFSTSPHGRRRFLREARAAAAVCHEHVVTIHAIDEAEGRPYLGMQYNRGQTLQGKTDRDGPLGLKEILRVGMQVASGLAAAHAQGLVHRDIKPANILLENGVERAKITDFGLARAATDVGMTQTGTVTGTPKYMSPEQARGEAVDHRTDLFSLGSLLYAMATGQAPFDGDSAVAVLRRVSDELHRPVRSLNPEMPEWLAAIIDRLMAKDRAARYQSASEVAELLASGLAELQRPGTSSAELVASAVPAASLSVARKRWRVLLGGVVALTVVASVVVVVANNTRRPARLETVMPPSEVARRVSSQ